MNILFLVSGVLILALPFIWLFVYICVKHSVKEALCLFGFVGALLIYISLGVLLVFYGIGFTLVE